MSPRAAWRLEQLGYDAHDYELGKSDWLAWGLEHEGTADLVGHHLTPDVPTCGIDTPAGEVADLLDGRDLDLAVVVTDGGVVLGKLSRADVTDPSGGGPAADLMHEGPTTVRPSTELSDMLHRMEHAGVTEVLVTRTDGVFLGVLEAPRDNGR